MHIERGRIHKRYFLIFKGIEDKSSRENSYFTCLKAKWIQTHYYRKVKIIECNQMNNIDLSFFYIFI